MVTAIHKIHKTVCNHRRLCKLEFVLYVNNIERTCCVARHCAKFSSGTKYIRLANPIHYLEEEVVLNTINLEKSGTWISV
jgi:hypothetical protein